MRKSAIHPQSHSLELNFSTSQQTLGLRSLQQSSSHRLRSSLEEEEDTTQIMSHNSRRSNAIGVLSLTRGTNDASSIVAYSTCVLLTLSTLWSVSLGMATGTTGESISLLNSSSPMLSIRSEAVIQDEQGDEADRHHHPHKCYVCLPPDKTSIDAQNILKLFSGQSIPPCASLTTANSKSAQFECPPDFSGCQTRSHGSNVSRSCTRLNINDCKTANSVELCYCSGPLCNDQKLLQPSAVGPSSSSPVQVEGHSSSDGVFVETDSEEREKARLSTEKEEAEARKFFEKGETDDEDLLEMQDDDNGSGNGQDGLAPPGVIDHYTTTPKPTLIPNKRGDSTRFKTTPPPASKATNSVVPTFLHLLLFVVFLVTREQTFFF